MQNTMRVSRSRHHGLSNASEPDEIHRRLRTVMAELQQARCALHEVCHAITIAEAELSLKRQERERVALQVAALAELVESLERDLDRRER